MAERLQRVGLEPWLDAWHLVPGAEWQRGLAEGLALSRACAVFVGPGEIGPWENQEVSVALDRAATDADFRIFLVLLPGLPDRYDASGLPPFLRIRTWVDYRGGLEDARAFRQLVSAVNGVPLGPELVVEADTGTCPYRGLEPFDEEHAEFFLGRDADIQRLLEKLKGSRFLAVLGASGSGKSSLVRAGLVPALRSGAMRGGEHWAVVGVRPGPHPLEALAAQLLRLGRGGAMQQTLDALASDPRTLHLAASFALADRQPNGLRLLLVVDQFEEVFTLCHDERERSALFVNLLYAAAVPGGATRVLLALRADFYHRCGAYPELAQQLAANQYLVSPLQPDGLRQAVEEPARRVGLAFEPGLVNTILDDVADQPGALPLLEHALLELWRRRGGGMLTLAGYRESGGVHGAIAKRAELVFESLDPAQQVLARRTFLRLTQPGEGTEDTRRRVQLSELEAGALGADVDSLLTRLVDARLLTTSLDDVAGECVEVAHEALIRGWPRLQRWIDEDRAGLRVHRRLTDAARDWEQHERDEGLLYRGGRLAEAVVWAEQNDDLLNELELEFVSASVALGDREQREREQRRAIELEKARQLAAAQQRAKRRLLWVVVVLLVGIAAAGVASAVALQQKNDAEKASARARSRALAGEAMAGFSANPDASLALALKAYELAPTPDAEAALRRSLMSGELAILRGPTKAIRSVAFSTDGRRIVSAAVDGRVRVWDSRTGTPVAVLGNGRRPYYDADITPDGQLVVARSTDGATVFELRTRRALRVLRHKEATSLVLSPDGKRVVTIDSALLLGGQARLWDPSTGKRVGTLGKAPVASAAFSSDGAYVVTAGLDGIARIWDAATGTQLQALVDPKNTRQVWDATFSRDGRRVVTLTSGGTVSIWRAESGERIAKFEAPLAVHAAFSPDGRLVATTSDEEDTEIWNAATGTRLVKVEGVADGADAFSPDSERIVTADLDGVARIWSTKTRKQLAVLGGHTQDVRSAQFSPDGRLVAAISDDRTVRVWQADVMRQPAPPASAVYFSPDGSEMVTIRYDHSARVWRTGDGAQLALLHWPFRDRASFSPDDQLVAITSNTGTVPIWKAHGGARIATVGDAFYSAVFSPNGRLVLTDRAIWEATTGTQVMAVRERPLRGVFSPDSTLLATMGQDSTQTNIWQVKTGKRVAVLHQTGAYAAFSPDGTILLTSNDTNGTARIWRTSDWTLLAVLRGHTRGTFEVAVSPDSKLVVTTSLDGTARVWQSPSGASVAVLDRGSIGDATFSPDSNLIVSAGADGKARVWQAANGEEIAALGSPDATADSVSAAQFSPNGKLIYTANLDEHRNFEVARIYPCPGCAPIDGLLARARRMVGR